MASSGVLRKRREGATKLRGYIGYVGDPEDGLVVYAHTARETWTEASWFTLSIGAQGVARSIVWLHPLTQTKLRLESTDGE